MDLALLTPPERNHLLGEAARYADTRLAEIGARAHYIENLHTHE
jgi:hypothetical protein